MEIGQTEEQAEVQERAQRMILPTTAWGSIRLAVIQNRDLMKPANTAFFRSNDS